MILRLLLAVLALVGNASCSLLIDNNPDQCSSDRECARFPGTVCDPAAHLCRAARIDPDAGNRGSADADPDGAALCTGDGGCYACTPNTDIQYGNACTSAKCRPFDNKTRVKRLPTDGGLPPVPDRG